MWIDPDGREDEPTAEAQQKPIGNQVVEWLSDTWLGQAARWIAKKKEQAAEYVGRQAESRAETAMGSAAPLTENEQELAEETGSQGVRRGRVLREGLRHEAGEVAREGAEAGTRAAFDAAQATVVGVGGRLRLRSGRGRIDGPEVVEKPRATITGESTTRPASTIGGVEASRGVAPSEGAAGSRAATISPRTRPDFYVDSRGVAKTGRGLIPLERKGAVKFEGLEVRGVRDLSHLPEEKLRAMQEYGFAAKDANGAVIQLHHHRQNPAGPLIELPAPLHDVGHRAQHPLGNVKGAGPTREQRKAFDEWRREYWKARANAELQRRGAG